MKDEKKKFYLVATPIGNLEDISYRAVRILSEVDIVLCEDTRVTKKLLDHYGITAKMQSYHAHSSLGKEEKILDEIDAGTRYALVSDAGTPTVSDPGVKIVHAIYQRFGNEIDVISVPGASAVLCALSSTGFMGNEFSFRGFAPHKKGRQSFFKEIMDSSIISVFYESPHRLMKTLHYFAEEFSDSERKICVARELTKMFEEKVFGTFSEVRDFFEKNPEKVRGEFVIILDRNN